MTLTLTTRLAAVKAMLQSVVADAKKAYNGPWLADNIVSNLSVDISAPDVPGEGSPNLIATILWGEGGMSGSEAMSTAAFIAKSRTITPLMAEALLESINTLTELHQRLRILTGKPESELITHVSLTRICDVLERNE